MGIIKEMKEAYPVYKERDPAIRSYKEVRLYPCFQAMRAYKKAHKLWLQGDYYKARKISQKAANKTGIEIHPGAVIGEGFFIDHGKGVVIGETTEIGNNVTLYQGVTLGGTGKETGKRHPTLCDGVMVSAGAKVLGSITIGENTKIGAGAVVLEDVPANCTVVGIPGRVVKRDNVSVPRDSMDQKFPDPVLKDLERLAKDSCSMLARLDKLEKKVNGDENL